ncbi:MAG: sulfite exporter TauE/SafE family protein [Deltaproteobacteria bacterium]|nr:sulfite exporter TauE/SafE family protein [Deltaproteobacteria bacterium]
MLLCQGPLLADNASSPTSAPAVTAAADQAAPTGSKLQQAIAKAPVGTENGQIDPSKPAGFLGIPGGPQVNIILALIWAIWVGWIFSTVGAFGGVMAGVGHMTVFGLGAYAKGFKSTAPDLNKTVTDSIRASNQFLVGLSALISSINYGKMGRLVFPLALALGVGSLLGAWGSATLTAGKVSFSQYQGYFGLFVLALGMFLLWDTSAAGQAKKSKAKEAAKAFEAAVKAQKTGGAPAPTGVKILGMSLSKVDFTFCGVEFTFNPVLPVVGGVAISAVAAFLGVGGGFLLVPFLTAISQLPMYLAAGTSALAVLISMITSILTLMTKGTPIDWALIGTEMVGVAIGSIVGPMTSKYLSDKLLKRLFIILAFYVGIDYVLRGFFNIRVLDMLFG